MINRTYKYRIYPTKSQVSRLNETLELCRWVYNTTLEVHKLSYSINGETLSCYDLQKLIPHWAVENIKLRDVYAQVLQNVVKRVDLSFKAFFRRIKNGENPGYPRFKGCGQYNSITYPQYGLGVRIKENLLRLPKIGDVKIRMHRKLKGTPKTLTISRSQTGKWYACISVEIEEQDHIAKSDKMVGIDVGLTHFATLSDGSKIDNPRFFKAAQNALAKAQRNGKPKKIIARIHERVANQRTDFVHQLSKRLVDTYDVIAVEKLQIQNMMAGNWRPINRSIGDAAWYQFRQFIAYKAESAGTQYIEVEPRGTSQRCCKCGKVVNKDLSVRTHDCPHCGLIIDRDHNAALNILALGLQCVRNRPVEASVIQRNNHNALTNTYI